MFHGVYVPQLPYSFVCCSASRLLPCPGYYKQCCDEHWGACVSFRSGFLSVYAQKWDCWVIWHLSRNLSNLSNDDIVPVLIVRTLEYITHLFFFSFFLQRGKNWNLSVSPFDLHFSSYKISVIALSLYIANACIFFTL